MFQTQHATRRSLSPLPPEDFARRNLSEQTNDNYFVHRTNSVTRIPSGKPKRHLSRALSRMKSVSQLGGPQEKEVDDSPTHLDQSSEGSQAREECKMMKKSTRRGSIKYAKKLGRKIHQKSVGKLGRRYSTGEVVESCVTKTAMQADGRIELFKHPLQITSNDQLQESEKRSDASRKFRKYQRRVSTGSWNTHRICREDLVDRPLEVNYSKSRSYRSLDLALMETRSYKIERLRVEKNKVKEHTKAARRRLESAVSRHTLEIQCGEVNCRSPLGFRCEAVTPATISRRRSTGSLNSIHSKLGQPSHSSGEGRDCEPHTIARSLESYATGFEATSEVFHTKLEDLCDAGDAFIHPVREDRMRIDESTAERGRISVVIEAARFVPRFSEIHLRLESHLKERNVSIPRNIDEARGLMGSSHHNLRGIPPSSRIMNSRCTHSPINLRRTCDLGSNSVQQGGTFDYHRYDYRQNQNYLENFFYVIPVPLGSSPVASEFGKDDSASTILSDTTGASSGQFDMEMMEELQRESVCNFLFSGETVTEEINHSRFLPNGSRGRARTLKYANETLLRTHTGKRTGHHSKESNSISEQKRNSFIMPNYADGSTRETVTHNEKLEFFVGNATTAAPNDLTPFTAATQ